MSDLFTLGVLTPVRLTVSQSEPMTLTNISGGTVYYKSTSDVSSSSNDGNITAGQSVVLDQRAWVIPTTSTLVSYNSVSADVGANTVETGDIKNGAVTGPKLGLTKTTYTQTYSTAASTVPTATASNPPAGGTGATAGAYDTAGNRDAMITSLTNTITDVTNLKKVVNQIIDDMQLNNIAS